MATFISIKLVLVVLCSFLVACSNHVQSSSDFDGERPRSEEDGDPEGAAMMLFCEAKSLKDALNSITKRSTSDNAQSTPQQGETCDPCKWIGRHVLGQCEEHCTCTKAGKWRCCRMRKEFSSMSMPEVRRYIATYRILTTKRPHKHKYDSMVAKHERLFSKKIHHWPQFWPWHRYFILKFENMLREIDCKVTLPYWDFTVNWQQPWLRKMWDADHLGGTGEKDVDYCVTNGPFMYGKWKVTPSAGGGCLTRHFDPYHSSISPRILTLGTYTYTKPGHVHMYEKVISVYMHSWVHVAMGGIMATHKSANEPSFWMLHSFADKLWGNWQQRGRSFMLSPYAKMDTVLSEQEDDDKYTVADMVDLGDLPAAGAKESGARTAVCYNGFMSVSGAYQKAHMHSLAVPRSYATEYSTRKSSIRELYQSVIRNHKEKAQFNRMIKEPFSKGHEVF